MFYLTNNHKKKTTKIVSDPLIKIVFPQEVELLNYYRREEIVIPSQWTNYNGHLMRNLNNVLQIQSNDRFDSHRSNAVRIVFIANDVRPSNRTIVGYMVVMQDRSHMIWCSGHSFAHGIVPEKYFAHTILFLLVRFNRCVRLYPQIYRQYICVNTFSIVITPARILCWDNFVHSYGNGTFHRHFEETQLTAGIMTDFLNSRRYAPMYLVNDTNAMEFGE